MGISRCFRVAFVALAGHDNVGMLTFSRKVLTYLPPSHTRDQLPAILEALYAIEPAFRYDVAEPNNSVVDDQTTLITAGVNLYLSSKAQFRLMYESQSFEDSSLKTISGFRTALTMNF